jgi:hypothetical protein
VVVLGLGSSAGDGDSVGSNEYSARCSGLPVLYNSRFTGRLGWAADGLWLMAVT